MAAVAMTVACQAQLVRAADDCGPESVTEFGQWFFPASVPVTATHRTERIDSGLSNTSNIAAMRLLVGVTAGNSRDWNLAIRDTSYRLLATFGAGDFVDASGKLGLRRWTGHLPGNEFLLDFLGPDNADVKIEIFSGVALPKAGSGVNLFSLVDPSKPWKELYQQNTLTDAKRAGDSVALIVPAAINDGTGVKKSWCCSGVLVSPSLMMTNWHCGGSRAAGMDDNAYWSSAICDNTVSDLGWGKETPRHQFSCSKVLAKDKRLDFALMRIQSVIGGATRQPIPATLASGDVTTDMPAFVVHHSECAEKLVSLSCSVKSAAVPGWLPNATGGSSNPDFSHDCNTERGASGAPVFDIRGRLIGLHHMGVKRAPGTCQPQDNVNKAVKLKDIIEFLKQTKPELAAELGQ